MSSSSPPAEPPAHEYGEVGLQTFPGSDDGSDTESFSCIVENPGTSWEFPPLPVKLPKKAVMAHWNNAADFFDGKPPEEISLWEGYKALRHQTMGGENLGASVRLDQTGRDRCFVVHKDAQGAEIARLSIYSAETVETSKLFRILPEWVSSRIVPINHRARFEMTPRGVALPSIGHCKAGRYFRLKVEPINY